jgi:site-specific DNA-methyltransferase (adenine-specific)/modification methylase
MTERITDRIEIVNADCYTLLDGWPSDAALVTDPPYGISHDHSGKASKAKSSFCLRNVIGRRNAPRIHGDDVPFDPAPFCRFGLVLLWGADHFRARLPEGGTFLAWNKAGNKDFNDSFSDAEFAWTNARVRRNVCNVMWKGVCGMNPNGDERKRLHPTQKPIELCAWCLTVLKVDSDALVIDPFMGSGSLGVACHRAGLRYLGVEIDPEHYATARERLRRETAQGILIPNRRDKCLT